MNFERDFSPEKELSLVERDAHDMLIATFTGRIAAVEHMDGRDAQEAVDRWTTEYGQRFDEAFDEMRATRPDLINDTSFSKQEEAIKFIEERLAD